MLCVSSWDIWSSKAVAAQREQILINCTYLKKKKKNDWSIITVLSRRMEFYMTIGVKEGLKSEWQPTHLKVVFKKYFILYKGGIGSISAFYGLCAEFLLGDKIIEQALGWTEGPTHVYQGGMFEAATLQLLQNTVLSNGHSVWAESVGKECYCTVCGLVLHPVWQLHKTKNKTNQAVKKCCVVWVKHNAADAFKNASYVSLKREPTKEKYSKQPTAAVEILAFLVKFRST